MLVALAALTAFLPAPPAVRLPTAPCDARPAVASRARASCPPLALATVGVPPTKKLYTTGEAPKVLGGLVLGTRQMVVVTGASSGLGLACTKALVKKGKYYVICAVRDPAKMDQVAKEAGIKSTDYTAMKLELASLQSVRDFVRNLKAFKSARPLNHLICNAAVYLPADPTPRFTDDGFEMSLGVNHLGHFLLVNLLLDDMKKAKNPRVCIVGSITGNTNTIGGGLVYPRADLGDLSGLEKPGYTMVNGAKFDGAKAYKDSKVLNMMTVRELHKRLHKETGITFSSMYPGCIAETNLFREKREWFRKLFPVFMKYVTGGYVSEEEAGERLAQVISDPQCSKSGVYWSWNGNAQQVGALKQTKKNGKVLWEVAGAGGSGGEVFENSFSDDVMDDANAAKMWDLSMKLVGLESKK
ncbi:hypothetical protein AB1Y20_002496 [Prymnesium parvum]|uniref:protochlorophyllide reductase n=1 Tax=Prymnesium parvum TaxID=97485 RepID=A0AB34JB86_PRYPA